MSWHVDASRRIGVSVGVSSVLGGLLQIDRKLKSVTRGAAGLRFVVVFLRTWSFGRIESQLFWEWREYK